MATYHHTAQSQARAASAGSSAAAAAEAGGAHSSLDVRIPASSTVAYPPPFGTPPSYPSLPTLLPLSRSTPPFSLYLPPLLCTPRVCSVYSPWQCVWLECVWL